MATILRSSKYIRCLNGLAQRIVAHENNKFVTKSLALQVKCINSYLTKSYATIPATQSADNVRNFDGLFNKLDENIQRYGRVFKPEVDAILSKVRDGGYISSLDALLLIRCCGELLVDTVLEDRNKLSQEIWTTLDTLKIRMDVSHFNALLRVYLENNNEFSPIEFLTSMRDKHVEPNRVTYQRLMLYHCKKGDIDGATKILEFMREKGLPLNEGVFSALIRGYSEANDMESAKNVMNVMKEAGVEPCSSTYTALLCAYAKHADMESIKQTMTEFESKNLYFQDADYFEIINVLTANGHNDEVDQILAIVPKGPTYNVDAAHAILKVLDIGNVDVALKILSTMKKRRGSEEDTFDNESGTFLIRKLVNAKYPADQIAKACEKLQQNGQHTRAFSTAVERALENGNVELSLKLLEEWMKHGGEIREHYFRPVLAVHGKTSNYQGIIDTVQLMSSFYNIVPSFETIRDFILPFTVGKWNDILPTLKDMKVPHSTITSAIATRMLDDHKIRKTAMFMMNYPSEYDATIFYRPLAEAVRATDDAKSYAIILRFLHDVANDLAKSTESEEASCPGNVVDNAITILISYLAGNKYETVDKILGHMMEVGLSFSPETGVELRQYFQDNMNPITDERIEKLTSGTIELVPLEKIQSFISPEDLGDMGESRGVSIRSEDRLVFALKRRHLETALKDDDLETAKNIIRELEMLNFTFSSALCAQLVDIGCKCGDVELAEKWINKAKADAAGFSLDLQKSTKYAILLIKNDRFDDAVKFIRESPRTSNPDSHGFGLKKLVKNLLDAASETGNVEKTNELFQALEEAKYLTIDNYMLGPLVKVHLANNDLEGALKAFEQICKNNGCTPMKNELSKKFIDNEDANSLQRLTDLSTEIHGESNSLVDLVLSFVECGRLRQARKILETPGLRLRGRKLANAIERYVEDGNIDMLEQFSDITKGLPVIDRREFYDVLMEAYSKKNNWQRGLTLWTTIQDEDLQPSDGFLKTLAHLLKRNDQPIPFICDDNGEIRSDMHEKSELDQSDFAEFYKACRQGELERAEQCLESISTENPKLRDAMTSLIENFLSQRNDLDKACKLVEEMMTKHKLHPRVSVLKSIWNGYINADEFQKLRNHGNLLSMETKKNFRFHKYLIRAELKEIGLTKYLANFESKLTNSKTHNFQVVRESLHFSAIIAGFEKEPQTVEKFHKLAKRLTQQDIYSPINLVWCYHFERNEPQAEEIWNKYLSQTNLVMFNYIIEKSRNDNDVELIERLYEKLETNTQLTLNSKVLALSSLVELYSKNSRHEDALKIVESVSPLTVRTWIQRKPVTYKEFKEGLEAKGKSFNLRDDDTRLAAEE